MRNKVLLAAITSAAAFAMSTPAFAQSEEKPFDGFYVGGSFGYDVQPNDVGSSIQFDRNLDGNFNENVTTLAGANAFGGPVGGFCNGAATGATSLTNPTTPGRCRNDEDGIAYYGRIGADTQYGNIVVGVVGEFGKAEITDSVTAFSTTPASYTMTRSLDWEGSIRGRIGYAANKTLFYGTFGGGYAKIDSSFTTTNGLNAFSERGDDKQFGFLGGGGIEQKIGKNFSIGMEYMFHSYQDDDYRVRATQGTAVATNPFVLAPNTTGTDFKRSDEKFRWHSIRATAAFRF